MAALRKTTSTFAHHEIPLQCDIYDAADYPMNFPVFLFFHAGGLVGGGRVFVPPWLVQTCYNQKWTLVSASYRLLPQAGGQGLLKDVAAAYDFVKALGNGGKKKVIVGGSSAGAFMATLAAQHLQPPPLALLCISGIATFHHSFFSPSTQLSLEYIPKSSVEQFLFEPVTIGTTPPYDKWSFDLDMLSWPSASKNFNYTYPIIPTQESVQDERARARRILYEYFVQENAYVGLVSDVDLGFEWAQHRCAKWQAWPMTIIIQGDGDVDVDKDVSISVARFLGEKASVFMARDQVHMFEATNFIEDKTVGMNIVRSAMTELGKAVEQALLVTSEPFAR